MLPGDGGVLGQELAARRSANPYGSTACLEYELMHYVGTSGAFPFDDVEAECLLYVMVAVVLVILLITSRTMHG